MQLQHSLAFLGGIGGWEWLVILIIALLLFGRRLPEVMRGLGGGVREFRKGIEGSDDEPPKSEKRQDRVAHDDQSATAQSAEGERKAEPAGGDSDHEQRGQG